MAMKVNQRALNHAKRLIQDGKFVGDSDWSEAQPAAAEENKFREKHDWDAYAQWFLAEDTDEDGDNKARYKFPYGDFNKVHRAGVIAAKQRAAQNDYDEIAQAADTLLDLIDRQAEDKG